jgi:hypothetical protein
MKYIQIVSQSDRETKEQILRATGAERTVGRLFGVVRDKYALLKTIWPQDDIVGIVQSCGLANYSGSDPDYVYLKPIDLGDNVALSASEFLTMSSDQLGEEKDNIEKLKEYLNQLIGPDVELYKLMKKYEIVERKYFDRTMNVNANIRWVGSAGV